MWGDHLIQETHQLIPRAQIPRIIMNGPAFVSAQMLVCALPADGTDGEDFREWKMKLTFC